MGQFDAGLDKPELELSWTSTDREHLGGAGSLLRVPHQHGFYKIIKHGGPADSTYVNAISFNMENSTYKLQLLNNTLYTHYEWLNLVPLYFLINTQVYSM